MSLYNIVISKPAQRQFRKLECSVQTRLAKAIRELSAEPQPKSAKKLKGTKGFWRIRVGDYRIIYSIHRNEALILVISLGHRREIYR